MVRFADDVSEKLSVRVWLLEDGNMAKQSCKVNLDATTTFLHIKEKCLQILKFDGLDEPFFTIYLQYFDHFNGEASVFRAQLDHEFVLEVMDEEAWATYAMSVNVFIKDERPSEPSNVGNIESTPARPGLMKRLTTKRLTESPVKMGIPAHTSVTRLSHSVSGATGYHIDSQKSLHTSSASSTIPVVEFDPCWAWLNPLTASSSVDEFLIAEAQNEALKYGSVQTRIQVGYNDEGSTNSSNRQFSIWSNSWVILREIGIWITSLTKKVRSVEFIDFRDLDRNEMVKCNKMRDGSTSKNIISIPVTGFCIFQLKAENTTAEWFEAINHAASVFHASPISRPSSAQFNAIKMTGDGESPYDAINVQKMQVDVEKRIASVTSQKSQKDVELITDAMDSFLGVLKATSLREAFEAYTRKLHTSENYVFHTHVLHFKMLCLNRDVALGALERRYWSRQAHFQALQIYRDLVDTSRDDNFQVTSESKVRAKIKNTYKSNYSCKDLFDELECIVWRQGIRPHYFDFMRQPLFRSMLLNAPHLSRKADHKTSVLMKLRLAQPAPMFKARDEVTTARRTAKKSFFTMKWTSRSTKASNAMAWKEQRERASSEEHPVEYEMWYERKHTGTINGHRRAQESAAQEFTVTLVAKELRGLLFSFDLEVICRGGRTVPANVVPGLKLIELAGTKFSDSLPNGENTYARFRRKKMELLRDRNATIRATFVAARRSLEVNVSDRLPFKINEGLEIIASDNIDGLPRIGWLLESFDLIKMRSKEQFDSLLEHLKSFSDNGIKEKRSDLRRQSQAKELARTELLRGSMSRTKYDEILDADKRLWSRSNSKPESIDGANRKVVIGFIACSHDIEISVEQKSKQLEFYGTRPERDQFVLTDDLCVEREEGHSFDDWGPLSGWSVVAVNGSLVATMDDLRDAKSGKLKGEIFTNGSGKYRFTFDTLVSKNFDVVEATYQDSEFHEHPKYLDNAWWLANTQNKEDRNQKWNELHTCGGYDQARFLLQSSNWRNRKDHLFTLLSNAGLGTQKRTDEALYSSVESAAFFNLTGRSKLWGFDAILHGWVRCSYGEDLAQFQNRSSDVSESAFSSKPEIEENEENNDTTSLEFRSRQTGELYYCAIVRRNFAYKKEGIDKSRGVHLLFFDPVEGRGPIYPSFAVNVQNTIRMNPARELLHAIDLHEDDHGATRLACRLQPLDIRSDAVAQGNAYRAWFSTLRAINNDIAVEEVVHEGHLAKPGAMYNTANKSRLFQLVKRMDSHNNVESVLRYYIAESGELKGEIFGFSNTTKDDSKDSKMFSVTATGSISYAERVVASKETLFENREFQLVANSPLDARRWIEAIEEVVKEAKERGIERGGSYMKGFYAMKSRKQLRTRSSTRKMIEPR